MSTAADRDTVRNLPLWRTEEHADTTKVKVPVNQLNKTVSHIHVHASRAVIDDKETGERTHLAHFRLYLQLKGEDSSVMLNSSGADREDWIVTTLHIVYYPYPFSTSENKLVVHTIPVHREFTVHEAIVALLARNRDRYRLEPQSGSGCRHWCKVVLQDFGEYDWVDAAAAATVEHATSSIKEQYPDVDVPTPAPRGVFF
ncbi:hypothetical protein BDZ89DRAFT_1065296 [Hymenopellis radicata]|nr:hypothetical protein BDZ89DRAFT_1065296 [Hymenopellis radicata]